MHHISACSSSAEHPTKCSRSLPCFAIPRAFDATSLGGEGVSGESELLFSLIVKFKYQSSSNTKSSIFLTCYHRPISKRFHNIFDRLFQVTFGLGHCTVGIYKLHLFRYMIIKLPVFLSETDCSVRGAKSSWQIMGSHSEHSDGSIVNKDFIAVCCSHPKQCHSRKDPEHDTLLRSRYHQAHHRPTLAVVSIQDGSS